MKHASLVFLSCLLMATAPVGAQEYICGDIDNDGDGPDIDDLVWMIDWMATGGPPPDTMIAANFGGCVGVNIHDLKALVNYLFIGGFPNCEDTSDCNPPVGGSITLDHVDHDLYPGALYSGSDPVFWLRVTNDLGQNIRAVSNGFRIYSPTGLTWFSTTGATVGSWTTSFDLVNSMNYFSCDGAAADSVGFFNSTLVGAGWPTTFDTIAYAIELQSVGHWTQEGQICLDTCWFPPAGDWMWETNNGSFTPSWDGPHCWIVRVCPDPEDWDCDGIDNWQDNCEWVSNHYQEDFDGDGIGDACDSVCCADPGNVDHSVGGSIDIADLVYLVDFMFNNGPDLLCEGEGNLDGIADIDIADLVYLVDYMFNSGPGPAGCH